MKATQTLGAPLTMGTLVATLTEFGRLGVPADAAVAVSRKRSGETTFTVEYERAATPEAAEPEPLAGADIPTRPVGAPTPHAGTGAPPMIAG